MQKMSNVSQGLAMSAGGSLNVGRSNIIHFCIVVVLIIQRITMIIFVAALKTAHGGYPSNSAEFASGVLDNEI